MERHRDNGVGVSQTQSPHVMIDMISDIPEPSAVAQTTTEDGQNQPPATGDVPIPFDFNSDVLQVTEAMIDFQNNNLSENEVAALATAADNFHTHVLSLLSGLKYFVPEAHLLNLFMLGTIIGLVLGIKAFVTSVDLVLLGVCRLCCYYDALKLKTQTSGTNVALARLVVRNVFICALFDQTPYLNAVRLQVVESESFLYTAFVICMVNAVIIDIELIVSYLAMKAQFLTNLRRKQTVKVVEYFAALWASCIPVVQWYSYIGNMWLALPYLLLKLVIIGHMVIRILFVLQQYLNIDRIGTRPTKTELDDRMCVICHNEITNGVKISCGHVFGEDCLRNWLERQNACPLCRATITVNARYPSASLFPPYIF